MTERKRAFFGGFSRGAAQAAVPALIPRPVRRRSGDHPMTPAERSAFAAGIETARQESISPALHWPATKMADLLRRRRHRTNSLRLSSSVITQPACRGVAVADTREFSLPDPRNTRPERTHLDIWDRTARGAFAAQMGVSDEKLRKAIRMVGSRITTLSSHLKT